MQQRIVTNVISVRHYSLQCNYNYNYDTIPTLQLRYISFLHNDINNNNKLIILLSK